MSSTAFSDEEMRYLLDTDFLLSKRKIDEKIFSGFERCSELLDIEIKSGRYQFNPLHLDWHPKISKGENYRGLPYTVLDNPRYFTRETVLSYRVLIWWGNFISFSLHLKGNDASSACQALAFQLEKFTNEQIYFCVADTPWEYHFEDTNYIALKDLSSEKIQSHFKKNGFIKIAKKATLKEWPILNDLAIKNLQVLTSSVNLLQQS